MRTDPHWNVIVSGDRWHAKGKRDHYRIDVDALHNVKVVHVTSSKREEVLKEGTTAQVAPYFKGLAYKHSLVPLKRPHTERKGPWFDLWWNR